MGEVAIGVTVTTVFLIQLLVIVVLVYKIRR